jgi:hypothetical protein
MGYNRDEAEKGPDGRYLEVLCHHGRTKKHCIYCEELAVLERKLADETQKCANLERYMLKGVAFRDELQAELTVLRARIEVLEKAIEWALNIPGYMNFKDELRRKAKEGKG